MLSAGSREMSGRLPRREEVRGGREEELRELSMRRLRRGRGSPVSVLCSQRGRLAWSLGTGAVCET